MSKSPPIKHLSFANNSSNLRDLLKTGGSNWCVGRYSARKIRAWKKKKKKQHKSVCTTIECISAVFGTSIPTPNPHLSVCRMSPADTGWMAPVWIPALHSSKILRSPPEICARSGISCSLQSPPTPLGNRCRRSFDTAKL